MRMLALAGAVALVVLAAVLFVGFRVLGEDEPSWGERATTACDRSLAEARAAVAAGESVAGVERRTLQVYAASTQIEAGLLTELEGLPRPEADELAIERTLGILTRSHQADRAAVERLRRNFDTQLLERRVNDTIPVLADVRKRFTTLGAPGCVRYYDPASYR
jgi:hypothetical protein